MPEGDQQSRVPILPLGIVIVSAFEFLWAKRLRLARAMAVPLLALEVIGVYWYYYGRYLGTFPKIPWYLLYCVVFTVLAVTCHRLVLLGDDAVPRYGLSGWTMRETRFLVLILGLVLAWFVLYVWFVVSMGPLILNLVVLPANWTKWLVEALEIPAIYVMARLSLAFPATALDRTPDVAKAWRLSQYNGWRLVVIVFLLPWLLSVLLGFLWPDEPSLLEVMLLSLVLSVETVIQIAALSYSYRALTRHVTLG